MYISQGEILKGSFSKKLNETKKKHFVLFFKKNRSFFKKSSTSRKWKYMNQSNLL